MSLPLRDLRAKVTVETDVVLEAEHRTTGRDKSEIARDWLHEKALSVINTHTVLVQLMASEGIEGKGGA